MNRSRQIAPFILIAIIAILVVAVLISVGRALFFRSSTSDQPVDISAEQLIETDTSRSVQMTVRGPIVANENFRSYRITISPSSRIFTSYKGYVDTVLETQRLGNNVPAYEEFVFALNRADMMDGEEADGVENDIRGVCATGRVFEFSILGNGQIEKSLWTSTCKGSRGTLDANVDQLNNLFTRQIPDSRQLIRDADL